MKVEEGLFKIFFLFRRLFEWDRFTRAFKLLKEDKEEDTPEDQ